MRIRIETSLVNPDIKATNHAGEQLFDQALTDFTICGAGYRQFSVSSREVVVACSTWSARSSK
jgi:hypothetical protein